MNSTRRSPPSAEGTEDGSKAPQTETEEGPRAGLSPGESCPPLAAAAAAPQKGPALPGRWEAGWREPRAHLAAGPTWLWPSRACSGTRRQQTLGLVLGAHAPSQPPRGTGREGKSSFLLDCGPFIHPRHEPSPQGPGTKAQKRPLRVGFPANLRY